jgi:hypothetical protein
MKAYTRGHIRLIRSSLSEEAEARIIHAFISSKLDNFKSLLYGLPGTCLYNFNSSKILQQDQ